MYDNQEKITTSVKAQVDLPPPINKLHGFHSQNCCDNVICVVPPAGDLHQSLLTPTNKHKATLTGGDEYTSYIYIYMAMDKHRR